ncbi:hypothetical protein [Asanoa sp. NPDC050611]|uniref:hypothetical protein n=1 Tax=Asanoa sp. NPDC050611 TaxID=3157098 RepID=UPI00340136D3
MSPAVCAAIAALALLAACAQPGTPVGDVAPGLGAPIAPGGAQDWDGFPVDQKPRPIIVTGGGLAEISGFNSGDGKLAFMTGRIELAAPLPETPATVTADLPDGRFAFPALRPDEAFALVRGQGEPANAPDASPAPIRITTITLGSAEFGTDRGRLRLPAWLFDGPDFIEPVAWPALAKEAFWRYGEPNDAVTIGPDQLSREGRRIRYAVPGQSNCPSQPVMRYRVEVTETAATVVLTTVGEVVSTPAPAAKDQPCLAIGVAAVPYDVDLSEPLGNRVVIAATDGARN